MNSFFIFFLSFVTLAGAAGCSGSAETQKAKQTGDTCIDMPLRESGMGTDWNVDPVHPPAPFYLDSIQTGDTVHHIYRVKYFISSRSYPGLGSLSIAAMPDAGFFIDETDEQRTDEAWVSSFYKTGKLISLFFVEQSYTEGAAHYNRDASTLNYNLETQKPVAFSDVFTVQNAADRQKFCELLNTAHNKGPEENQVALDTTLIGPDADFMIGCGAVFIYPGEIPSMGCYTGMAYSIPLEQVKAMLRPEYSWLAE